MDDSAARFASELHRLRTGRGLSYRALAELATQGKSYIEDLEKGRKPPSVAVAANLDKALRAGGRLAATLRPPADDVDAELEALELARRVIASDVSSETLDRLERAGDEMAMAYATTPPDRLLPKVRRHLDYVGVLVGARKTLAQHRRLLVVGGWLSLLRATLHIDLRQAGLALLVAEKPDEAAAAASSAISSGRIVPSNWWRASEVVSGVRRAGVPEADDLRQVAEAHRPTAGL